MKNKKDVEEDWDDEDDDMYNDGDWEEEQWGEY